MRRPFHQYALVQGAPKISEIDRLASGSVPAATETLTYDSNGYLASETDWNGVVTTYVNDVHRQPTSITEASGTTTTLANKISYEPFGPLAGLTYGSGLTSTRSYDQDYRLTGIVTDGATTKVQNLAIAYDGANNITAITDVLDSTRSQTFTYDADYHLTKAVGNYSTETYSYDADGNRTSETINGVATSYSYAASSNELTSTTAGSNTCGFTYTANGTTRHRRPVPSAARPDRPRRRPSPITMATATRRQS